MTRRKGEMTTKRLKRQWPHHVALEASRLHGLENSDKIRPVAASLGAAQLTFHETREGVDYIAFCFVHESNAKALRDRFDGKILNS